MGKTQKLANDSVETVTALLNLTQSQNLHQQAEASCRQWLQTASDNNDLGGWSIAEIGLHFDKCALVLNHSLINYPFIETQIGLYVHAPSGIYLNDLRPIGYYRLITLLDGTVEDNYCVLDVNKIV